MSARYFTFYVFTTLRRAQMMVATISRNQFRGGSVAAAILGVVLVAGTTSVQAAPDKVIYELQERCGRHAEEWFKREFGNGIQNTKDGQAINTFRNHYSARLNKCFLLTIRTDLNYKKDHSISVMEILSDMNDNKDLGTFFEMNQKATACNFGEQKCASRAEWEALIKPQFED